MFKNEKQRPVVSLLLLYHVRISTLLAQNRLSLLIMAVFSCGFHMVLGLWSILCCSSKKITPSSETLSLAFVFKCLSNFLVWEKTQFNQNFFLLSSKGEGWTKRGESKEGGEWRYANERFLSS